MAKNLNISDGANSLNSLGNMIESVWTKNKSIAGLWTISHHFKRICVPYNYLKLLMLYPL